VISNDNRWRFRAPLSLSLLITEPFTDY